MREERIEYNTIRDDFSVYEVENGQILKAKFSLVDILSDIDSNEKRGSVRVQPYSYVITPNDIEKYGIKYEQGIATEEDQIRELKFTPLSEIINIYETKKFFILVGIKVKKVFLTDKINSDDDDAPILRYQSLNEFSIIEKSFIDGSNSSNEEKV